MFFTIPFLPFHFFFIISHRVPFLKSFFGNDLGWSRKNRGWKVDAGFAPYGEQNFGPKIVYLTKVSRPVVSDPDEFQGYLYHAGLNSGPGAYLFIIRVVPLKKDGILLPNPCEAHCISSDEVWNRDVSTYIFYE